MMNSTIEKLYYFSENTNSVVTFETLSGELLVQQRGESLVMDFPLNKPEVQVQSLKYRNAKKYFDTLGYFNHYICFKINTTQYENQEIRPLD